MGAFIVSSRSPDIRCSQFRLPRQHLERTDLKRTVVVMRIVAAQTSQLYEPVRFVLHTSSRSTKQL